MQHLPRQSRLKLMNTASIFEPAETEESEDVLPQGRVGEVPPPSKSLLAPKQSKLASHNSPRPARAAKTRNLSVLSFKES